jgi:zinc transporter ZupT
MQNNHDYLFSLLNCLAGGVAIGVAFSHLLPDAVASLAAAWPKITYPYAYLIATASLLLLYSIDLVASDFHPHTHDTAPEHKHKKDKTAKAIYTPTPASESTPLFPNSPSLTPVTLTPSPEDVRVLETPVKGSHKKLKEKKHDEDGHKKKKKHPVINAYVFLAGITVHSLFEGNNFFYAVQL